MAYQPPDAVRHLRGPPESRPRQGLNIAVSCSSQEQCLKCIQCCKSYHSTPVITGSAWERRFHSTRLKHGVIKPQSSRCLILWMCVSRKRANGEIAVFVEALHAAVNLGQQLQDAVETPINACSLSLLTLLLLCNLHKKGKQGQLDCLRCHRGLPVCTLSYPANLFRKSIFTRKP